jgi:hypothetical protein
MDTQEANSFVKSERARWFLGGRGNSDAEFLRKRERLLNALTMVFALLALVNAFWVGMLGWGEWSLYYAVVGAAWVARQCSTHADRCGEVRRLPEGGAVA